MTLSLPLWLLVFVVSLAVLIKASDSFTVAAERIGLRLGIPAFIVGGTIVALGTSLPELVSSIFSVVKDSPEIVLGNVVGSNITNSLLVLGMAGVISKSININHGGLMRDLVALVSSAIFMGVSCIDGTFSRVDAAIGAVLILLHLIYTVREGKKETEAQVEVIGEGGEPRALSVDNPVALDAARGPVGWRLPLILVVSGAFICGGAQWTIEAVINMSEGLGVGKELIAITAVAIGTSLPELAVTLSAAMKGKAEIAVGNVLGSNIFNTLCVLTLPAFIGELPVVPSILAFGLPVMLLATVAFVVVVGDRKVSRLESGALLGGYVLFLVGLFV